MSRHSSQFLTRDPLHFLLYHLGLYFALVNNEVYSQYRNGKDGFGTKVRNH